MGVSNMGFVIILSRNGGSRASVPGVVYIKYLSDNGL